MRVIRRKHPPKKDEPTWTTKHTVGVVLTLSSAILCGLVWFVFAGGGIGTVDYPPLHNTITWVAIVSLLTWCLAIIGWGTIGRPTGVIDTRNQMSLSRLQAAAWTILVV